MKSIVSIIFIFSCLQSLAQTQKDSIFTVDTIIITGNKKTRTNIITRELTFKQGDTIHNWQYQHEQSRRQLINLFLFNEIQIKREGNTVTVHVTERWYIWPYPELDYADRNFSQWLLTRDPKRLIYGLRLEWYNIRGRNETMQLDLITGYTRMVNFGYKIPYFNKKQTWGAQVYATYSSNKEVWYKTADDKVQFFRDKDRDLIKRKGVEFAVTHRKKIFSYHMVYAGYNDINVEDTVHSAEVNSRFLLFDNWNNQQESYIGYSYTYDKRDFKGFPLNGYLLKAGAEAGLFSTKGIPAINYGQSQFTYSRGAMMMKLSFSRYLRLGGNFFGSFNVTARRYSLRSPPYTKARALGYNKDYIRGYELKVIDGRNFVLGKSEIKYRFLNRKYKFMPRVKNYEILPVSLFLSTYFDIGYVNKDIYGSDPDPDNNKLPNTWQYGYGTGLNIVMFYDYCFRAEYSFDRYMNSRMYFSFVASM